jgi:hypothetical protein
MEEVYKDLLTQHASDSEATKIAATEINKLQEWVKNVGENGGMRRSVARQKVNEALEGLRGKVANAARAELDGWSQLAYEKQQNLDKAREGQATKRSFQYQKWKDQFEAMTDHELQLWAAGYIDENNTAHEYDKLKLAQRELRIRGIEYIDSNGNHHPMNEKLGEKMKENLANFDWLHTTDEGKYAKKKMDTLRQNVKEGTVTVFHKEGQNDKPAPIGVPVNESMLDLSPLENLNG